MVLEKRLYDLLVVDPKASAEEISRAFKKLALKYHPDKTNKDPELTERFKDITKAYEVLKDEKIRSVYDNYGERGLEGIPPLPNAPFNSASGRNTRPSPPMNVVPDLFSQMFSSISGTPLGADAMLDMGMGMRMHMDMMNMMGDVFSQNPQNMSGYERKVEPVPRQKQELAHGADIHHVCNVSLEDLYRGKVIKLRLPKNTKCTKCDGVGGWNPKSCRTCQGHGQVLITTFNQNSQFRELTNCSDCRGTGTFINPRNLCSSCSGIGYKKSTKIIKARVYPGFKHNDRIVLRGEGDEARNIIPGDVIITLKEVANPNVVRRDNDLFIESNIDLRTAILGGKLTVPDFIYKGNDLNLMINVHGLKQINDKYDKNIQKGEILGVIDSTSPRCVSGLGMPITSAERRSMNGSKSSSAGGGVYFQVSDEIDDDVEIDATQRGNLYIKFNIVMPSLNDFSLQDLMQLDKIFPTISTNPNSKPVASHHLENIPSEGHEQKRKRVKPNSPVSKTEYNYSDIEADSLDPEREDEAFYQRQWQEATN